MSWQTRTVNSRFQMLGDSDEIKFPRNSVISYTSQEEYRKKTISFHSQFLVQQVVHSWMKTFGLECSVAKKTKFAIYPNLLQLAPFCPLLSVLVESTPLQLERSTVLSTLARERERMYIRVHFCTILVHSRLSSSRPLQSSQSTSRALQLASLESYVQYCI